MTVAAVSRYAYLVLAWLFLGLLLVQIFIAGLGIFGSPRNFALHVDLGWMLHLAPLPILLAAALSRAGRKHWVWALALAVAVFLVPLFVPFRTTMPEIAALHPVAAVISFGLAAMVARNSLLVVRAPASRNEV